LKGSKNAITRRSLSEGTRKVGKLEINNMSEINFYFIFQILSGFFFLILFQTGGALQRKPLIKE